MPRSAVGVVIGKNGDMIKKIQNETGARVQFQQGRDDNPDERMCALTGTMNQIEDARQRIEELIESVLVVPNSTTSHHSRPSRSSAPSSSTFCFPFALSQPVLPSKLGLDLEGDWIGECLREPLPSLGFEKQI